MNRTKILEGGTVVEAHDTCLAVEVAPTEVGALDSDSDDSEEVEGVEVFVGTRLKRRGCTCCGDTAELDVSYNLSEEKRVEKHGEADPLDLN